MTASDSKSQPAISVNGSPLQMSMEREFTMYRRAKKGFSLGQV
ncbi:hypothetical protein [Sphingobacterium faecium]